MILFSPPRCDFLSRSRPGKQATLTTMRFSIPLWPAAPTPHLPRQSKRSITRPSPPRRSKAQSRPRSTSTPEMSFIPGTPRSPLYSPTLGSIPEVFEYESLDQQVSPTVTPNENHDSPEAFTLEASSVTAPKLTRATSRDGIIQSPPRKSGSFAAVSKVLRKVLEADRIRRRRILRVYLKAIVFLKYLWRANERYGNVMVTTGMYMQR